MKVNPPSVGVVNLSHPRQNSPHCCVTPRVVRLPPPAGPAVARRGFTLRLLAFLFVFSKRFVLSAVLVQVAFDCSEPLRSH